MSVEALNGKCPTCEGEATVYPSPTDEGKGHVYCEEEDCGWIHRDLSGIDRYLHTGDDRDA